MEELVKIIKDAKRIVFFGGAGVSTESGIPDFRSANGVFKQKKYPFSPEYIVSHEFFQLAPESFYDFYFNEMNIIYKKPAYLGDILEVCKTPIENGWYVHLQTKDKEVCVAGAFKNT